MSKKAKKETTLNELSRSLGVNKSKLSYYVSKGLLKPKSELGGMYVFDREKTLLTLKRIEDYQKKELTLKEIKMLLKQ